MKLIKLTLGMTGEFEIIGTNAPDNIIEEQLHITCGLIANGKPVTEEFEYIKAQGYFVNAIGSHDDLSEADMEEAVIDKEFDVYDYCQEYGGGQHEQI